ncbi:MULTISPECIES: DUF4326 domain-containing protein [unclassified Yoonia]|uniref:DUF4326 domain-containing protein n=1 Tax=unclassified Yoonia TaxID=2629118 RepID=UPI002AFEE3B4|nr:MULTISPECIES: DUF4326 domain-containing protein [unclassified Yoonia]
MQQPKRIQLRRTVGWRKPEGAVVVTRGSGSRPFANPYQGDGANPDHAYLVQLYRAYLARPERAELVKRIKRELRGKDLCCWCALDKPCHADVLLAIANAERTPRERGIFTGGV